MEKFLVNTLLKIWKAFCLHLHFLNQNFSLLNTNLTPAETFQVRFQICNFREQSKHISIRVFNIFPPYLHKSPYKQATSCETNQRLLCDPVKLCPCSFCLACLQFGCQNFWLVFPFWVDIGTHVCTCVHTYKHIYLCTY